MTRAELPATPEPPAALRPWWVPVLPWMLGASAALAVVVALVTRAAVPDALSHAPITAIPPNVLVAQPKPLVMLNMSRDHQLFYRAYNEYSDYNKDGQPDRNYLHTVRYSGYFDTNKCYTYDTGDGGRFNPSTVLANRTDLCTGAWHGNFLNWATMTRMDVLRKVLYGGTRVRELASLTVIERASLPMDAHSFAKFYEPDATQPTLRPPINGLTPFNETQISLCNTTLGDNTTVSHTNTNPPLLRAARGNFALWNSHERRQCRWDEETIWDQDGQANGNDPARTGFLAASNYPSRATNGLNISGVTTADYTVRVAACVAGLIGTERCRDYPSGTRRPIGLLQEYGEANLAEFGLLTGSFSNNVSGGVLRKNAGTFRNEVNYLTDGSFIAGANGIVATLDRLKVYGFRYSDATYSANDNDFAGDQFCAFQTIGLQNGKCASWGNPIGEMYIETLRYLRGLQPTAAFGSNNNSDAKGTSLGITVATWEDPLANNAASASRIAEFGPAACRPINVLNFNASVLSYDGDNTAPFSTLGAAASLDTYTNQVGAGENINGTSRFVGNNTAGGTNNTCTAKTLTGLADARGLCPAAPAYAGSYSLAGAAYWANTNAIRDVPATLTGAAAQRAFRVRTYGVALAPGVPRIAIRTAGGLEAEIQPAYRLTSGAGTGSGTMVDFRVISQTPTSGRYLVLWEDSEQGGDYDQDFNGIISWQLNGNQLSVTTQRVADSTGGGSQGFGYVISGTDRDGVHFHTGILGFNYNDPTNLPVVSAVTGIRPDSINASGGCDNCTSSNNVDPTTATYTITGNVGRQLQDPMLYAARWGGARNAQGIAPATPPGAGNPEDVPSTYFEVFNPDELEASLRAVFADALRVSNAAPAVPAGQLVGGSFKYVARYDPDLLVGDVDAFQIDATRNFSAARTWSAGERLSAANPDTRQIITNDITAAGVQVGMPFTWAAISGQAGYLAALQSGTRTLTTAQTQDLVAFMRGVRTVEGNAGGNGFRLRRSSAADNNHLLGPIVNAAPWVQVPPSARFLDTRQPGYRAYAVARRNRPSVLWVAANDGMLHALDANTGNPLLSYVPRTLVPRLNELVVDGLGIRAFVDGSPFTADVDINAGSAGANAWRTYVFGTLGRGGRGVYALDATNVNDLTAANAANVFRWEFNANDDRDLGHIVSDVSIEPGTGQASPVGKMQDGSFALVMGNGASSADGRAALFILPVRGPATTGSWTGRYTKIVVDAGPNNGLSAPVLLDLDNDGRVDTAYAGDLRGNLWKFDLSSANPSEWRSAYVTGVGPTATPTPLYIVTAADGTTRLPISGAPQVAFPRFGGIMVTVATGKSLEAADFPRNDRVQRAIGIWDRPTFATGGRALPRGFTTLTSRTVQRNTNGDLVATAASAIDYQNVNAADARDGWYFDLPGTSEMVISNIGFRANAVFFTSIRPPGGLGASCSVQPDASLYLFDPIAGAPTRSVLGTVEVNGVQTAILGRAVSDQKLRDVADATAETTQTQGGSTGQPPPPPPPCPDGGAATRFVGQTTDLITCTPQTNARRQWREIPGLKTLN